MIDQENFVKRTKEHKVEKANQMATELLAYFLKEDLPFFDVRYIETRVIQKLKEAADKCDWENPIILKARQDFMKIMIKEMLKNIPVLEKKKTHDETEERDQRCEPVAQKITEMVLNEDLLCSDPSYLKEAIRDDDSLLVSINALGYLSALMEILTLAIDHSYLKCVEKLFGRSREKITFTDLDIILKSKN